MNLKFPDLSSNVIINDAALTYANINRILHNFVQNDIQLANPDGFAPKIWECKWYNDSSISGYPVGYAVWYNTESPHQFIQFYAEQIYTYAKDNTYLKNKVRPYSEDQYEMYYNILTGYSVENTTIKLPPLFDIGEISDKVQIKISLCADNKAVPSDPKCWKDFIMRDNYEGVSAMVSAMLSSLMQQHMNKYHFSGQDFDGDLSSYLLKDMSNIEGLQRYSSHMSDISSTGFEYVQKFVKVPTTEKYLYNVVEDDYQLTCWKLNGYDQMTNNGKLTQAIKNNYIDMMSDCANYISSGIETVINDLTDRALIDIQYFGINPSIVPFSTDDFSIVSARLPSYNCKFTVVPLSTNTTSDILYYKDYYTEVVENKIDYYPIVEYTFYKWFRQWSSGKLEYGGIVPVNGNGQIEVEFGWKYVEDGQTKTAPLYDYPTTSRSFYGVYAKFNEDKNTEYDESLNLKPDCRYIVEISPVQASVASHLSGDSYGYSYNELFHDYGANEANSFKNDGFKIYIDDPNQAKYYQYYVTGFKTDN